MALKHRSKSGMQLQTILCADFSSPVTDSVWIRADDAYFVGEIKLCNSLVSDSLLGKDSFQ